MSRGVYTSLGNYDDSEFMRLVGAAAEALDMEQAATGGLDRQRAGRARLSRYMR